MLEASIGVRKARAVEFPLHFKEVAVRRKALTSD